MKPLVRAWLGVLGVLLIAFAAYWLTALAVNRTGSPNVAYFDLLAQAFLQGRLFLVNPPATLDLNYFRGEWYVPFPPLPAFLLLPWVAFSGVVGTNTVLFSTLIGAFNVALIFLLLQAVAKRNWTHLKMSSNLALTVLFGLGTVHWYMATMGSVWFVSQICAVSFIALATWIAVVTDNPFACGTALALAMLARPNVGLSYPILAAITVQKAHDRCTKTDWNLVAKWVTLSLIPVSLAVGFLLTYNWIRFQDPLDFGYLGANVPAGMASDLRTYGQFSIHYLPHNVYAMLLELPEWDAARGHIIPRDSGMSILITTPAILYLMRVRRITPLSGGAWLAVLLVLIPLWTYYNTGFAQFGYRFSLDFMVPVMLLLAIASGNKITWDMLLLMLIGIGVNAWGVSWFGI